MEEACFIGVDIGTQGTKAALHAQDGSLLAEAFQASRLIRPGAGMVEEDPEEQLASVCRCIARCLAESGIRPGRVACIALDGQMAGTIGIGADGLAVTAYDSWLDTRCAPWITRMSLQASAHVMARTGNAPSFNQGPKILFWKHERPEVYSRIRSFVQPGSYVAMRLCGLGADQAFVDDTYLHFSGFADNEHATWDEGLCAEFGIEPWRLPAIYDPARIVGGISNEAASMTGLPSGTPVAAGLGDTAASFLACGATQPGICVDVAGTASVFATTTQVFVPDSAAGILGLGRSAVRGLWHPYAYINGGGMNILWFADSIACGLATAQKGSVAAAQAGSSPDYDDLDALVRDLVPLADDPWFIPHFEGRVMPSQSGMRGAWAGLRWSHGLDRLYRAILEGAAFEYRIYLDAIRRLYPGLCPAEVRMTGGGSRSLAWTRTKADVLGLAFRPILGSSGCPAGGAPMGAAMLAAAASMSAQAALPDPSILPRIATSWVKAGEACLANPVPAPLYATRYAAYLRLLDALAGFPGVQE